ncbi:MAG: YqgE/AlgH family protein [Sphingomonadales bacterium]|nr:YqgE/AlgH family protein [Sphingomonadales bacterium]
MHRAEPGTLLVAEPFLKDENFLRSVVLLCEHGEEGSVGFVLTRRYKQTLNQLIPALDSRKWPLFYGGPVQTDSLHFIHQYPRLIPGSREIRQGIWWGGDFSTVLDLLREGALEPERIRFFIGYSGWDTNQLNQELDQHSWLLTPASSSLVFHRHPKQIWNESLKSMGGDYAMMINFPIDPLLN